MDRCCTKRKLLSTIIARTKITFCILALLIYPLNGTKADGPADISKSRRHEILRQNFLVRGPNPRIKSPIGCLSLRKVTDGSMRAVRFDHRFRSYEKFRIAVSSTHDAYLFVLHRSPSGKLQVLWPPDSMGANGRPSRQNKIRSGEIHYIPPEPGTFTFDTETGVEAFYIALGSSPKPPPFPQNGGIADEPEPAMPIPSKPVVKIRVRGHNGIVQKRGVYYDPGIKDPDPNVYFSAKPGEEAVSIFFEFTLQHE